MIDYYTQITAARNYIRQQYAAPIHTGIVLGTGLGGLATEIEVEKIINYADIPNFPISTVESHKGKLVIGKLGGKTVAAMQGRFHYYEGYTMRQVAFPIYVMQQLGIEQVFISNAAGGLNPAFQKSDLMLITDHISFLLPDNPLRGENIPNLGLRFPDMSAAYCPALLAQAKQIAAQNHWNLQTGSYIAVPGPMLETKAEYKLLRNFGADAVGMSTVPEVIAAKHCGMKVFAVSVITDLCYEPYIQEVTLENFIAAAKQAEPTLQALFKNMLQVLR